MMVSDAQSRKPRVGIDPSVAEEQLATVEFLGDPSSHGGLPVERIDTHISHIFLVGDHAYKLKRSLRTNFLDFTTILLREAACRREIEVNVVVASAIYHQVLPIVRHGDDLALGGEGELVDWVVSMHRFDRTKEFDVLAESGRLNTELIESLADVVAQMHDKAPRTPDFGGAVRVLATIRQIADGIAEAPKVSALTDLLARWRIRAEAALDTNARRFDTRRRHGFVRRCHGDLHLGNICMFDGRPTPFDALEFNEEMASIDVLYDIAFIIMDLMERDLRPLSNAFLNRYLSATRDYSGLALLPLFISMRAAVRALVAACRPVQDSLEPSVAQRLTFASESLSEAATPRLIAIGGLSGSGKSTIARRVAPQTGNGTGAVLLRSDVARKRLFNVAPEERLPDGAYGKEVSSRVYLQLARDAGRAVAAGSSAILDATFLSIEERWRVESVAERAGVRFTGIWLDCDPEELRRRVSARGRDASDAEITVLNRQLACHPGAESWVPVFAGGGVGETVTSVLSVLCEYSEAG
jgi:uncharacterized protein